MSKILGLSPDMASVGGGDVAVIQEEVFRKFTSQVVALPLKDIDTDAIIPGEFLKTTSRLGLGKHAFTNLRKNDPNFPEFKGERIIVAGKNFGCGSSREHAVWALKSAGIDVVISSEFADIFRGNAEKNGLLTIQLGEEIVQTLLESMSPLTVDLANQKVIDQFDHEYHFEITGFVKKRLLENLSDLDYLLKFKDKIKKFNNQK